MTQRDIGQSRDGHYYALEGIEEVGLDGYRSLRPVLKPGVQTDQPEPWHSPVTLTEGSWSGSFGQSEPRREERKNGRSRGILFVVVIISLSTANQTL